MKTPAVSQRWAPLGIWVIREAPLAASLGAGAEAGGGSDTTLARFY